MTIVPTAVAGNFDSSTFAFISSLEGSIDHFYLDSEKIVTIGVGFALLQKSGSTFVARPNLATAFSGIHTFSSAETTLLNDMALALSSGNPTKLAKTPSSPVKAPATTPITAATASIPSPSRAQAWVSPSISRRAQRPVWRSATMS